MTEKRTYVYGQDCSKCHGLMPRAEKAANAKGVEYKAVELSDNKDPNIMTVPTLIVENGETVKYLADEDLVLYIQP